MARNSASARAVLRKLVTLVGASWGEGDMVNPTGEVKGSAGERSEMSDRTNRPRKDLDSNGYVRGHQGIHELHLSRWNA